ncbi:MAG: hypothetical protein NVSMB24_28820 [Mucilaginibacter sp.]
MSFFSAGTFVVWGGIAYQFGWVAISIQWTMCIGALITGFFIAPKWKGTGSLTAAEYIHKRFGPGVQKVYIYIFMFVSLFLKGSILYAVAKLIGSSINQPFVPTAIILGIFMISYTAVGGLWAVMVTDIIQFVVLTATVLLIFPIALHGVGGIDQFIQHVPPGFLNATNGQYTPMFIFAYAVYHTVYIGGNWTFVQRYTSVKDGRSASKVAFLFAGLYFISPVIWMLPPMFYHNINPNLHGLDTENAYLYMCKRLLPPGLLGLMLTAMYFSTSASANTVLNVVSAIFTNDIYKSYINTAASDQKLMKIAKLSSWCIGTGMIAIALIIPFIGGIVKLTISIGAITGGPLLAPPIWGLFSKNLSGRSILQITLVSLLANLSTHIGIGPFSLRLSVSQQMLFGIFFPLLLLGIYELGISNKRQLNKEESVDPLGDTAITNKDQENERTGIAQNIYGLKVISFSLIFLAALLFGLGLISHQYLKLVASIAAVIFVSAIIPWEAAKKASQRLKNLN